MHRIDHSTRSVDENGAGKDGFTEGSPGTVARTVVTDDWLNDLQEEMANLSEMYAPLVKGAFTGAFTAIQNTISLQAVSNLLRHPRDASFVGGNFNSADMSDAYRYCVVGTVGETQFSDFSLESDFDHWTTVAAAGAYSGDFNRVEWIPTINLWVVVGNSAEIETSPASPAWTKRTIGTGIGAFSGNFEGIAFDGTTIVVVGDAEEIQSSTNGTTWTQRRNGGTDDFKDVIWSSVMSLFVAVGTNGLIMTSPDGTTWTSRSAAGGFSDNFYAAIATATGCTAAGGAGGGTDPEIQTTTDGITWAQEDVSLLVDQNITGLCLSSTGIGVVAVQQDNLAVYWGDDKFHNVNPGPFYKLAGCIKYPSYVDLYVGFVTNGGIDGLYTSGAARFLSGV
jgi:hypothetical protein